MIYQYFGISKQAVHQYRTRYFARMVYYSDLLAEARVQRRLHPRMGAKVLYSILQPQHIGRIRYEKLLRDNGFILPRVRSYFKTTDAKWVKYKNLIGGKILDGINQVWVTDITYYVLQDGVAYITTIMDLYSRFILGYSASLTLESEESSMKSINMAFKVRGITHYAEQLIHHSDRGSQYRYSPYIQLLEDMGVKISMCKSVYENPHMERLNGTIKNDYLLPLGVKTFSQLKKILPVVVFRYNTLKPHSSLRHMTPARFEQYIGSLPSEKRPKTKIKKVISTIHSN